MLDYISAVFFRVVFELALAFGWVTYALTRPFYRARYRWRLWRNPSSFPYRCFRCGQPTRMPPYTGESGKTTPSVCGLPECLDALEDL